MSKIEARLEFRNRALPRTATFALSWIAASALGVTLATPAYPEAAPRPEVLIKWRQSAFQVIAWNTGRLKSALSGNYDRHEVSVAARALSAVAGSGLANLFPAGTEHGKGWRDTTANADVFQDAAKFRAKTDEFARAAAELARLADSADQQAVTDQFARVAKTCKSCHDSYRQID